MPHMPHNKLFNDNYKFILSTFTKLIKKYNIKCKQTIDDIMQESFILLLNRLKKYDPEKSNIEKYINVNLDFSIKIILKKYFPSKKETDYNLESIPDNHLDFTDDIINKQLLDDVINTIDDPILRQILQLKRKGFKQKEISQILNVHESTITRYVHKLKMQFFSIKV